MQHLGQFGLHALALTGSQNNCGQFRHGKQILLLSSF
jgi:hypothetical protein